MVALAILEGIGGKSMRQRVFAPNRIPATGRLDRVRSRRFAGTIIAAATG